MRAAFALVLLAMSSAMLLVLGADDLTEQSDEFDANSLGEWSRAFEEDGWATDLLETLEIADGALVAEPHVSSWFEDYRGAFIYKEMSGDIVVTVNVTATGRSTEVPGSEFSLGGLMMRRPNGATGSWTAGDELWTFIAMGTGTETNTSTQFEVKTTASSSSTLELQSVASPSALLQLVKVGGNLVVLVRVEGEDWRVHRCYGSGGAAPAPRSLIPDVSDTVQVGMHMYSDFSTFSDGRTGAEANAEPVIAGGNPDLRIVYEWIRFKRPSFGTGVDLFATACSAPSGLSYVGNCCDPTREAAILAAFGDNGFDLPDGSTPAPGGSTPAPSSSPSAAAPRRPLSHVGAVLLLTLAALC